MKARGMFLSIVVLSVLLLAAGGAANAAGTPPTPQATAPLPDKAMRAKTLDDPAIVQQCINQIAPDLGKAQPKTPAEQAQAVAAKQAVGGCVQKAQTAALTPEQRAQLEAQQQADAARMQACVQQVAPELAQADRGTLTADEVARLDALKRSAAPAIAVCMGEITPEQAAQMRAKAGPDPARVNACIQQVGPELAAQPQEPRTPAQEDALRAAKQRVGQCLNQGAQ